MGIEERQAITDELLLAVKNSFQLMQEELSNQIMLIDAIIENLPTRKEPVGQSADPNQLKFPFVEPDYQEGN